MADKFHFTLTPAYSLFNGAAVMSQNGNEITFVVENPDDALLQGRLRRAFENHLRYVQSLDECPEVYRRLPHVSFCAGKRAQIRSCVSLMYKNDVFLSQTENAGVYSADEEERRKEEAAAVLLLDSILCEARDRGASDIHIEKGCVRLRICGRLSLYMSVQYERNAELIRRIKLLAGMNVIERRRSQDGHFVYGNTKPLFVRVSSMPLYDQSRELEESVVLRLLDTSRIPLELQFLGFSERQIDAISELEEAHDGLVLVCGPTGAGKSTTVASILTEMEKKNFGSKKIISLEDPPEYVIPDVCQIRMNCGELFADSGSRGADLLRNGTREHVKSGEGNSFSDALTHVFRQDPDVVMIGEIRDEVTAETAVRAAMTGHLVFATLHTGSAAEAVLRMENLGTDRRILHSVLRGIICQELEFVDGKPQLYADVALPLEEFFVCAGETLSEEEIDALFMHENNYMRSLAETVRLMGNGHRKGLPVVRSWNGGSDGKKVHRLIG